MKSKSICNFLDVFLLYFIGALLTTQSVNGGVFSERDLDTLLLRSGHSIPNDNEAAESSSSSVSVPKEIQDLVASAPAVSLDSIPGPLKSVIQYALERPYPGKAIEAPQGSHNKLKKTIVYLITSRLRQRGNNNEVQVENETEKYGSPVEQPTPNVFRTVLQEAKSEQNSVSVKARTVLQPKTHYSGRNILSQQQSKQSYSAPVGRTAQEAQSQRVITIHPRPTPPSPDFEIIRTLSSEAGPILALTQKQNLQSAYRAAAAYNRYPSEQVEIQQEQPQSSSVHFVTAPHQDVDEGLSVVGGPEGLSDIVSKIEGLGDSAQPGQLVLSPQPNTYTSNLPPVPVAVDLPAPAPAPFDIQGNNEPISYSLPAPPQSQPQLQHHTQPNEYITYLNPPLVDQEKPGSPIHFDGPLKTLPFKRINRFFQNVLKSFRSNLASLRNYTPKITYESDPWPNSNSYGSNSNNGQSHPSQHQDQQQHQPNQPVLVSTTTYSESPPHVHQQG